MTRSVSRTLESQTVQAIELGKIVDQNKEYHDRASINKAKEPSHATHDLDVKIPNKEQSDSSFSFAVLFFSFFTVYMGRTMVMPVLTFYAASVWNSTNKGTALSDANQSLLGSLFFISYSIGGVVYGPLSNKYGRRPIILLCLGGMSFGFFCQGLSPNFWMLVISRTFTGFFAAVSGVVQSYITDVSTAKDLPKITSRLGIIYGIVWGLGPGIATIFSIVTKVIFPTWTKDDPTIEYRSSFLVGCFMTLCAFIWALLSLKESLPTLQNKSNTNSSTIAKSNGENVEQSNISRQSEKNPIDALAELYETMLPENQKTPQFKLRLKKYMIWLLVVTFFCDVAVSAHCTIYPLMQDGTANHKGLFWNQYVFGFIWVFWGLAYSSVQLFFVSLVNKFGLFKVCALGFLCKCLGNMYLPLFTQLFVATIYNGQNPVHYYQYPNEKYWQTLEWDQIIKQSPWLEVMAMLPGSMLIGLGYGLCMTSTQAIMSDFAKRYNIRSVATWLGIWMCAVAAGSASVLVLGYVTEKTDPFITFYLCSFVCVVSIVILVYLDINTKDITIETNVKKVVCENEQAAEKIVQKLNQLESENSFMVPRLSLEPSIANGFRLEYVTPNASYINILAAHAAGQEPKSSLNGGHSHKFGHSDDDDEDDHDDQQDNQKYLSGGAGVGLPPLSTPRMSALTPSHLPHSQNITPAQAMDSPQYPARTGLHQTVGNRIGGGAGIGVPPAWQIQGHDLALGTSHMTGVPGGIACAPGNNNAPASVAASAAALTPLHSFISFHGSLANSPIIRSVADLSCDNFSNLNVYSETNVGTEIHDHDEESTELVRLHTHTLTRESLMRSLSNFAVATPLGLPILTATELQNMSILSIAAEKQIPIVVQERTHVTVVQTPESQTKSASCTPQDTTATVTESVEIVADEACASEPTVGIPLCAGNSESVAEPADHDGLELQAIPETKVLKSPPQELNQDNSENPSST